MKPKMAAAVFTGGAGSIVAQTVIIREGLVMSGGNEVMAGIMLALWLVWTAAGSFILARWRISRRPERELALILVMTGAVFLITFVLVRAMPRLASLPWGETVALDRFALIMFGLLSGIGLCFGSLFPVSCRVLDATKVFVLEALGSCLGGAVMSFLLIGIMPASASVLIAASLVTGAGLFVIDPRLSPASLVFALGLFFSGKADAALRRAQMPGHDIVACAESKYGLISVTRTAGQVNFFASGVYDFSFPDEYSTEEAVQYAMLYHPCPVSVLLIGGGIGGCVSQVLKHPQVDEVVYAELDPELFWLGKRYADARFADDLRVSIVFADGRFFVNNTAMSFDVIIVNLPDPLNGVINRYYTGEFFAESRRIMKNGGVISVRLSVPADIISPAHAQYLKTVYRALERSFDEVVALPASKMNLLAFKRDRGGLRNATADEPVAGMLERRILDRKLELKYVNAGFLEFNLSAERLGYARQVIDRARARVNTDMNPSCYYYSLVLWGGRASPALRRLLERAGRIDPLFFLAPVLAVLFFIRSRRRVVYFSVACAGATVMSLEIVLIMVFQAVHGFLYGWIGAMIAAFMAGLAVGACMSRGLKRVSVLETGARRLALVHALFALFAFISILSATRGWAGVWVTIPILLVLTGVIGGLVFPCALDRAGPERAGTVYGFDLAGSAAGSVVTAVILIPVQGALFTLGSLILLNAVLSLVLLTARPE